MLLVHHRYLLVTRGSAQTLSAIVVMEAFLKCFLRFVAMVIHRVSILTIISIIKTRYLTNIL